MQNSLAVFELSTLSWILGLFFKKYDLIYVPA